jgi:hypothetical protein
MLNIPFSQSLKPLLLGSFPKVCGLLSKRLSVLPSEDMLLTTKVKKSALLLAQRARSAQIQV